MISFTIQELDLDFNPYSDDDKSNGEFLCYTGCEDGITTHNTRISARNGVFRFEDFQIYAQPGHFITMKFSVTALEAYGMEIPYIDH